MHSTTFLEGIQCGLNALFAGLLFGLTAGNVRSYLRELAGLHLESHDRQTSWKACRITPQTPLSYGNRRLFPPRAGVVFGRA